uniref:Uncharacterized protein n=1 Tax=Corvus moneduloides TaxID=1196302 RepID=A0A8U7NHJ9_CORMO
MKNGKSPVIIDNTNIHAWEMKPYVMMVGKAPVNYHPESLKTHWCLCQEFWQRGQPL